MEPLRNIHPGEVVAEEFLSPLKISVDTLAHDIDLPQVDIIEIIIDYNSQNYEIICDKKK